MSVDSLNSVGYGYSAVPTTAPQATTPPTPAAYAPNFKGEGEEQPKKSHTGSWILGLAIATVAGIIINKKIKAKNLAKAGEEAAEAAKDLVKGADDAVTAAAVAKKPTASVENITPEGKKALEHVKAKQAAYTPPTQPTAEKTIQDRLADFKARKEITAAFEKHDKETAEKALSYVNSKQAVGQYTPAGESLAQRAKSIGDAKAAFTPITITKNTAAGKLASGEEFLVGLNKKGQPTEMIIGDGQVIKNKKEIQKILENNKIDLTA